MSGALHGLALAVIIAIAVSQIWIGTIAIIIAVAAWRADRHWKLETENACIGFRWSADHRLVWYDRSGRQFAGTCVAAQSWGVVWVRLKYRDSAHRRTQAIGIPADSVDAETHRRLRARCRVAPPLDS